MKLRRNRRALQHRVVSIVLLAGPLLSQEPRFVGANACKVCHPGQFEKQSASTHAGSLRRVADHPLNAAFSSNLSSRKPAVGWAFGAGTQAVTFVSRWDGDHYLEHRLSWYPALKALSVTPGHDSHKEPGALYRIFEPSARILRCFQCHSTGRLQVSEQGEIQPAEVGVRCETCHGPGGDHRSIVNPQKYSAAEINQLCGSCHRKPAAAGDDTDFQNTWNVRHQPLYLAESACFLKSAGKLSCLTCHDAHSGRAQNACAGCHPSVKHPAKIQAARRTCEACHMPAVSPRPGLKFANHWIGVFGANKLVPVGQRRGVASRAAR